MRSSWQSRSQASPGRSRARRSTLPALPANARTAANSLSRITLDDNQSAQNPPVLRHPNGQPFSLGNRFRGGDLVTNTVGVLGFDFSLYRIYPTAGADYMATNPRTAAPAPVGGTLRVAAMNTLNFFVTLDTTANDTGPGPCGGNANLDCRGADADQPLEFQRQRDKLLAALSGLNGDIIGLNELENTPNVEPLASIVSGLPGYDYIHTGTIGTDAIKVGLIYRPAVVTPVGSYKILNSTVDPRFIDTKSRPTLAQTFEVNATGARFTIAVNHLKSKGSDCADVGDPDLGDGQGNCSQTRRAAAEALVDWLATDPTGSGDPDFLIMGDLNSYAMEQTLDRDQGRLRRHSRHQRRLHEPDRPLPGRVRVLVHVRRAGRLPRPRPRERQPVRPGHRRGGLAHQLGRAGHPRLRHVVQAAGTGGAVRAERVPHVGPRPRRRRAQPERGPDG